MDPHTDDLRELSERLDGLLRQLDAETEHGVRDRVREAVGLLLSLHAAGFARLLELAGDGGLGSPALRDRLADDPIIGPLLLVHQLHPHPVDVRIGRALDRLRPHVAAHGCRAAVVAIENGAARIRLDGGARLADGADLRDLMVSTLSAMAPELTELIIDNGENGEPPVAPSPLIQITRGPARAASGGRP